MPATAQPPARLTYTVAELLDVLHISKATLYKIINRGELRTVRIGRRVLVRHAELDRYLDSLEEVGPLPVEADDDSPLGWDDAPDEARQ